VAQPLPELRLRIPATSANLGPGFDMFGLALNLYTRYHFNFRDDAEIRLSDANGAALAIPPEKNLIAVAYHARLRRSGLQSGPGFECRVDYRIPFSRGFGSSASALVAGVAAARHVLAPGENPGAAATADDDVQLLDELEGHPDNVCPARIGGFTICYRSGGRVRYLRKTAPADLGLVAIAPDFTTSTKQSRQQLPEKIPVADSLSNMTGVLLWREYLESGDPAHLCDALGADRLHEPYRKHRLPALDAIRNAAPTLGLYGATISGSGPGLLVYFPRSDQDRVLTALADVLAPVTAAVHQRFTLLPCEPDYYGLTDLDASATAAPVGDASSADRK
jgi:homoserine kinase